MPAALVVSVNTHHLYTCILLDDSHTSLVEVVAVILYLSVNLAMVTIGPPPPISVTTSIARTRYIFSVSTLTSAIRHFSVGCGKPNLFGDRKWTMMRFEDALRNICESVDTPI